MSATATGISSSSVSRLLRSAGYLPTPRGREGVHVTGGIGASGRRVHVSIDLDSPSACRELADGVAGTLRDAGYTVSEDGVLWLEARIVGLTVERTS